VIELTRSEAIDLLKTSASCIETIGYPTDMKVDVFFDELDKHGAHISEYDHHLFESADDSHLRFSDGTAICLYEDQHFYYHETKKGAKYIWCERDNPSDRRIVSMALVWGGVEKRQWRRYVIDNRKLYNLLVKECKVNGTPVLKGRTKSVFIQLNVDALETKAIDDFFKKHDYESLVINERS
jgi:hypothetical protein